MALAGLGCGSNHHVSPWGDLKGPPLGAFVEAPDLDARLAEVAHEAEGLGLPLDREITTEVKGARFVARSYAGRDEVGRALYACRVVTPFGVVLAAGPNSTNDVFRHTATELVPAVGDSHGFRSLSDLTGSGALDVILRADDGRLEIWRVKSRGSTEVEIDMEVTPTEASDIDGDGRVDLGGAVLVRDAEVLRPSLRDVAMFDGSRFSDRTDAAKAWHAGLRDAAKPKDGATTDDRLRSALEIAWHGILAGGDREKALVELRKATPSEAMRGAFSFYVARIERINR